jgi:hypothetical protein
MWRGNVWQAVTTSDHQWLVWWVMATTTTRGCQFCCNNPPPRSLTTNQFLLHYLSSATKLANRQPHLGHPTWPNSKFGNRDRLLTQLLLPPNSGLLPPTPTWPSSEPHSTFIRLNRHRLEWPTQPHCSPHWPQFSLILLSILLAVIYTVVTLWIWIIHSKNHI